MAEPHCLECRDPIENATLSEECDAIRRQYERSKRRRDAAEVPPEPRPGRVDELPLGEVGGTSFREHRFTHENCGRGKNNRIHIK